MLRVMTRAPKKTASAPRSSSRRIVFLLVPPVDELDLVGPLQVFNSINRLAGRPIYSMEVVTNSERLQLAGEGGVLTFMARQHFRELKGSCDSVLLVCGLGSRSVRDAELSAWLKKTAGTVRRVGAVCVGAFLLAIYAAFPAGTFSLTAALRGPFRVRALVRVRCPRTGRPLR